VTDISFNNFKNRKDNPNEVPPPVQYNLPTMDFSRVGGSELLPLSDEDLATTAAEDMQKHMDTMKQVGYNPTKLGTEMSDEEFKKFHGINW